MNVDISGPLSPQMSWSAGTQCVAKRPHTKPKPGELAYHKGEMLTILDVSLVLSGSHFNNTAVDQNPCFSTFFNHCFFFFLFLFRRKDITKPSITPQGRKGSSTLNMCVKDRLCGRFPASASCRMSRSCVSAACFCQD